jgi:hypothetical protein
VAAASAVGLPSVSVASTEGNFRRIYRDPALRDQFFWFVQNIFHLYPEVAFHQMIIDLVEQYPDDQSIYIALQEGLAGIKTWGSELTYQMPALAKQKRVMRNQTGLFLDGKTSVDGYLEIGTTGRYYAGVGERVAIEGPVFVCNDIAPGNGGVDLLERGQLGKVGTFVPLGNYDPMAAIPDGSMDLVTNYIGFHHCPNDRLDGYLADLGRVVRPDGLLLVREHDVASELMHVFVALAHDVFNAGVQLSWAENAAQLRNFRSMDTWYGLIEQAGFERVDMRTAQAYDPTDNHIIGFRRR